LETSNAAEVKVGDGKTEGKHNRRARRTLPKYTFLFGVFIIIIKFHPPLRPLMYFIGSFHIFFFL
jgi:hypothetical protein